MTSNEAKQEKRQVIFDLQNMLFELKRGGIINTNVIPDGIFGDETTAAVMEIQNLHGLYPNGVVDGETWKKISQTHSEAVNQRRRAETVRIFPEELVELKIGDDNDAVFILQIVFRRLANQFREFENSSVNGNFDAATERNVKAFQRLGGLDSHGRVDKKTWNRIIRYYNLFEN